MLPLDHPDRIQIAFDDHRLVANAGLLLPVTLAQRLGLRELVDHHLDLGNAPGRANPGDKMLTLVASAPRFREGRLWVPSCAVSGGGHVRQLDRVSRELLAHAWAAGAGPGDAPMTIDLDSTICETHGLAKEGARDHGYTGKRGYHPLLAVAAGTGDVLMVRLREGRANTARGAAHFLRETVGRVRYAGASGQLTVRADSGFYTHALVAACRRMDVRFSITIRQSASLRSLIEAIPEQDWTPIPYWMDGAAAVAETSYIPFQSKPDAAPVRLIVRRVKPTPGSQLALFATYSYHGFITDRDGEPLTLEADHRRPQKRLQTAANPPSTRIRARTIAFVISSHPLPVFSRPQSVSIGGFGIRLSNHYSGDVRGDAAEVVSPLSYSQLSIDDGVAPGLVVSTTHPAPSLPASGHGFLLLHEQAYHYNGRTKFR